jgi:hypothetical protein
MFVWRDRLEFEVPQVPINGGYRKLTQYRPVAFGHQPERSGMNLGICAVVVLSLVFMEKSPSTSILTILWTFVCRTMKISSPPDIRRLHRPSACLSS